MMNEQVVLNSNGEVLEGVSAFDVDIQKQYNTSSLIITHDVDCARVISDWMILLIDGTNYAEGTFEELSKSKDPKIMAFFKH